MAVCMSPPDTVLFHGLETCFLLLNLPGKCWFSILFSEAFPDPVGMYCSFIPRVTAVGALFTGRLPCSSCSAESCLAQSLPDSNGVRLLVLQICCPRSLRGVMAPTATSALPSLESQLANITGKTPLNVTYPRSPLMLLLLPFSTISHEFARALYSPGQNLTKWRDEITGQCTTVVMWGRGVGALTGGVHRSPVAGQAWCHLPQAPHLLRS